MPAQSDQAVVLRLSDFSETSQVVTLYTRNTGLVRLLAKGVRRATRISFAPGLDLLEWGECHFIRPRDSAGLGTLMQWRQIDAFAGLRGRLAAVYAGLYAAELTAALNAEHDPHPALFDALLALLSEASHPPADNALNPPASDTQRRQVLEIVIRFQAALLRAIGYAPNLRTCGLCGRARTTAAGAYFSSAAGGYVCRVCAPRQAEKRRLPQSLLASELTPAAAGDWFDVLSYHLAHVAGRPMRSGLRLAEALGRAAPAGRGPG